jgi:hypothetical protein
MYDLYSGSLMGENNDPYWYTCGFIKTPVILWLMLSQ